MEKNVRRAALRVVPETVEGAEESKYGPAVPIRTKMAITCGSQANLLA
jgi:hypothetical protein